MNRWNRIWLFALLEIFSDKILAERLAFRGGTALHKLYLNPQPRYSEDIDLVQITSESFGLAIDALRERLSFLGTPTRKQKENNNTLIFNCQKIKSIWHLELPFPETKSSFSEKLFLEEGEKTTILANTRFLYICLPG